MRGEWYQVEMLSFYWVKSPFSWSSNSLAFSMSFASRVDFSFFPSPSPSPRRLTRSSLAAEPFPLDFFLHVFLFLLLQLTTFILCEAMPLEMRLMLVLSFTLNASALRMVRALKLESRLLSTEAVLAAMLLGSEEVENGKTRHEDGKTHTEKDSERPE